MRNSILDKILMIVTILFIVFSSTTGIFADERTPYRQGLIEGFLTEIGKNEVSIEEYDGTLHTLSFGENPIFSIDTLSAKLSDFRVGMEVYATLRNRKINYMEGYSTVEAGYIEEGSKTRVGTIKTIDRNQLIIALDIGGVESYFTGPGTIFLKDGLKTDFKTLYVGDRVKLYFDEMDTSVISIIAVQGKSIEIKGLYKGRISVTHEIDNKLTLTELKVFNNGEWQNLSSAKTISYSENLPIYIGGQKITPSKLKHYRENIAYLVIKDFFSTERIESMVIKANNEFNYLDKIGEINWYSNSLELAVKHRNLSINNGTIVIKNGRLVDINSLDSGMDAFIVGDGNLMNQMNANVIYVYNEDINNSNIGQDYIYEGRLDSILPSNSILLKDFALLNNNAWEGFRGTKELFYDDDTLIYDLDEKKMKTLEEFKAGDYAIDENSDYARDNDLEDRYVYIYADGDRIVALMVQKNRDSLLRLRTTNGVAAGAPEDHKWTGWRINISNAIDYSPRKDNWMARKDSFYLTLEESLIIKNNKIIEPDELKQADRLYIIRDDFKAKIIIVK
ncbi:MAG: hypothetical protein GX308_07990 [Epulopiscium sp.]|nr:hypothetical protein [Candidatus Epulonipiscium sp.]